MFKTELVEVGDSLGLVLPDALLSRWNLTVDDTIFMTETASGFMLSPHPAETDTPAIPYIKTKNTAASSANSPQARS
ncbi:MAG: hypothetical protein PHQ58_11530 [Rhodoferax sp.]|uniref:AbrB/MazE/SpoVT family DNA-binding domain-containing protein n=1 Tax=Rhodoferax sp. TaxID=50421 RepID=UPI00262522B2|nr:hypothetical protein [Rhodoferax sp.]MDD2881060.1 hypothetical protein [Rhodoferax sp.]